MLWKKCKFNIDALVCFVVWFIGERNDRSNDKTENVAENLCSLYS